MTTTIRQLLEIKGTEVYSVTPDTLVFDAIKKMNELSVGALLVIENEELVGIISERDYTRKVIIMNRSSRETPVKDIMTENVIYMTPEQTVDECMATMSENQIRHIPIVKENKPVGVLTVIDVMKNIINEKKFSISQLENYIAGSM